MKKEHILIFIFAVSMLCSCNKNRQLSEPLTPEQEKVAEEFREAIRQNQLTADSIARSYNTTYGCSISINGRFDRYSPINGLIDELELYPLDVPYYGLCNSDTTEGFLFSLHFPKQIIDIKIHRILDEYVAYDDLYKYILRFR